MAGSNKNFRKLCKLLNKAGFEMIKEGNHCIFAKQGYTICVTKNVKDPAGLFKRAQQQWERERLNAV